MNSINEIKLKYKIVDTTHRYIRLQITMLQYPKWFKHIDFLVYNTLSSACINRLGKRRTFQVDRESFFIHGNVDDEKISFDNYRCVDFSSIEELQKWIKDVTYLFYILSKDFADYLETPQDDLRGANLI